jgi:pyridoxal phosphate enzyme (YggS family)
MGVSENLTQIRERIRGAAARSGRRAAGIKLVAVTKEVPDELVKEALADGITALAENRPQELVRKQEELATKAEWHLIGNLQTNKVNKIIDKVTLIHSLDRWRLAETLSQAASQRELMVRALVQVNVSGEDTKNGIQPTAAAEFLASAMNLPGLRICGLMTIAPFVHNPEEVRSVFTKLRELSEHLQKYPGGAHLEYLSMGMSGDFEVAVEEGANILRIGTAIFGS